jgi:hypothetical protein
MTDQMNHNQQGNESKEWYVEGKGHPGRDMISSFAWAAILIWAGCVFLANNLGYLNGLRVNTGFVTGVQFIDFGIWPLVFTGAGVILIIEAIIRLAIPSYRHSVTGSFILGAVFLGIGLGQVFSWNLVWPFLLIAVGLIFLTRGFDRR